MCAGHSLGGAVAALTTLRLLRQLPPGAAADVRCVSFAAPAIGNARLQAYVRERGWERHFSNLLVPGVGRGMAHGRVQDVALLQSSEWLPRRMLAIA